MRAAAMYSKLTSNPAYKNTIWAKKAEEENAKK
jgi:hypothetical protein